MSRASRLFREFHGHPPGRTLRTGVRFGTRWLTRPGSSNILIPESLAVAGTVVTIVYDTMRDGVEYRATHKFKEHARPELAAGTEPGQLFLLGDGYRFTDRGIIDT